ncbi:MAG: hypothetical protein Q8907_06285 [Bacteroidota bacterium]|nr:hypothetical protein [Bacteroidota bacterium]MDP4273870.1 hypothetical protein [Bacteroidota bacterium]
MNNILVDTGFWYALYTERDEYYIKANELVEYLELGNVLIPYPSLYETINTRFSKNTKGLCDFKSRLEQNNFELLEDEEYKSDAIQLTFESSLYMKKPISLVDMVIRQMLADDKLNINFLITFNPEDFIDVCIQHRIKIISE